LFFPIASPSGSSILILVLWLFFFFVLSSTEDVYPRQH